MLSVWQPLLKKVLELALSGRLDPEMFPSINSRLTTEAPTEVTWSCSAWVSVSR